MKKTVRLRGRQKPAILIRFNLLPVCPSVLTFVFAVLLIPSFNTLSDYFFVSLNLEAVPIVRILIKFKTQLLQTAQIHFTAALQHRLPRLTVRVTYGFHMGKYREYMGRSLV